MASAGYKNILILNLTRMGDLIQSTPLLKGLKAAYPQARLTLVVGSEFAEFSKRLPAIDERVVFDLKQFNDPRRESLRSWVPVYRYLEEVLNDLADRGFDLVINLSHSKLSAFMIAYLGIPDIRGFCCNEAGERMTQHPWLQYFFTEPFNRAYNTFNLVDIFCRGGGLTPGGEGVEIKTLPEDHLKARKILAEHGIGPDELVVGIQAGSSLKGRRWPAARFGELADRLAVRLKARILLFGVASESELASQILATMKHKDRVVDLTGKTDIGALIGLVQRCRYLVTNDTGTMHIAAALGVRIVGLFFAHAHPPETGPYAGGHLIFQAHLPCAPCSYGVECNHIICIDTVRPELVASAMEFHAFHAEWRLPEQAEALREVQVFHTEMDTDQCLRMRPMVKHPLTVQNLFCWAYRRLWLDTLMDAEAVPDSARVNETADFLARSYRPPVQPLEEVLDRKMQVLTRVESLGRTGLEIAHRLERQWEAGSAHSSAMKEHADQISRIDENINLAGLTHPEIKPITDLFNKRKENIDGEDVLVMIRATRLCYKKLLQECRGMKTILAALQKKLGSHAAWEEAEESSIRMAVPGK